MQRMLNPARVRLARLLVAFAILAVPVLGVAPLGASHSPTDTLRVTFRNHTNFLLSPPVVIAAPQGWQPFALGEAASPELEDLAEMGMGQPLADRALAEGAYAAMVSDAPLHPGEKRYYEFDAPVFDVELWALTMAVQTNDGFFAAHTMGAPGVLTSAITQAYFLDAGTEVNDELCETVPGSDCGGTGGVDEGGVVHMHPGMHHEGDISSMYNAGGGLWAVWERASIPVNPGPSPRMVDYELYVGNMTDDQLFSPVVIGVHPTMIDVVPEGEASTPGWTALAENGDNSVLAQEWMDAGVATVITTTTPIDPGGVMKYEFTGPQNGYVFWCAMLVSTNDGFTCGTAHLPKKLQSSGGYTGAYDNGTEANTYAESDVPGFGGTGHVPEDNVVRHHPDFPGHVASFWSYWDPDGPDSPPAEGGEEPAS
ncbi:hypothetical protein BH23CHL2_BH23CHL2_04200 [soil metagenome]